MIVYPRFAGDGNKHLMNIQHAVYMEAVVYIARAAVARLREAESHTRQPTLVGDLLPDPLRFDHRVLQDFHDLLAAAYRWERQFDQPDSSNKQPIDQAQECWLKWLSTTCTWFYRQSDILHSVLEAIVFANQNHGLQAEERLRKTIYVCFPEVRPSADDPANEQNRQDKTAEP